MIKIKKVLNSSVVLVEDEQNKEYIMFGKGIGYGQKAGNTVEEHQADQIFMPIENVKVKEYLGVLDAIPPVYVELTGQIVAYAEKKLQTKLNTGIYFTLMDHLHFAVERLSKNIAIANKVFWEIKNYYAEEFAIGLFSLEADQRKAARRYAQGGSGQHRFSFDQCPKRGEGIQGRHEDGQNDRQHRQPGEIFDEY